MSRMGESFRCPHCPEVRPSRARLQYHVDAVHLGVTVAGPVTVEPVKRERPNKRHPGAYRLATGRMTVTEAKHIQDAAHGLTHEEIAEKYDVSRYTVGGSIARAKTVLHARNITNAVALAIATGQIDTSELKAHWTGPLTPTCREHVRRLALGDTIQAIADARKVSVHTVHGSIDRARAALFARNVVHVVALAITSGQVEPDLDLTGYVDLSDGSRKGSAA